MLGAFGLATREVPPHVVSAGIPAKVLKEKDRNKQDSGARPHPSEGDPARAKDNLEDCNC
jgi:serine acetyltransferase